METVMMNNELFFTYIQLQDGTETFTGWWNEESCEDYKECNNQILGLQTSAETKLNFNVRLKVKLESEFKTTLSSESSLHLGSAFLSYSTISWE